MSTSGPPTFVRITIGLFVMLLLFGAALAVLLVRERKSIEIAGGWGRRLHRVCGERRLRGHRALAT